MPNLVDDEQLPAANSLLQTVENLTWMVGPVVGGVLIAAQGPDLAYWVNAVTFVALGGAARADPGRAAAGGHVESRGHWRDLGDGFGLVLRSRALLDRARRLERRPARHRRRSTSPRSCSRRFRSTRGNIGFGVLLGAGGLGLTLGSFVAGPLRRPARDRPRLRARDRADGASASAIAAVAPTICGRRAGGRRRGASGTAPRSSATRCSSSAARPTSCAAARSR